MVLFTHCSQNVCCVILWLSNFFFLSINSIIPTPYELSASRSGIILIAFDTQECWPVFVGASSAASQKSRSGTKLEARERDQKKAEVKGRQDEINFSVLQS